MYLLLFQVLVVFTLSTSGNGEGAGGVNDEETVLPFEVSVSDDILKDLQERLQRTRLPSRPLEEDEDSWRRGTSFSFTKKMVEYWKTSFDWRSQEKYLNSFPQFITTIDDVDVHFIHVRSPHPDAEPLILVHGWPGSVLEFYKIIPLLTSPPDSLPPFHVVCPSLPGYGFSKLHGQPKDQLQTAHLFHTLMTRLGYNRYWAQGGDWGSLVTTLMTLEYPSHVIGLHLNMLMTSLPLSGRGLSGKAWSALVYLFPSAMLSDRDAKAYSQFGNVSQLWSLMGYFHLQATKPQTLGYSLHDSPVGLATYVIEKFSEWGYCNNGNRADLLQSFTMDELLTNVVLYWIAGPSTTINYYYEFFNSHNNLASHLMGNDRYVEGPVGVAAFPGELVTQVRAFAEWGYNIVWWSDMERGGHFAAMEEPHLLARDVQMFRRYVESLRKEKKDEI